jgi:hypothetical protein
MPFHPERCYFIFHAKQARKNLLAPAKTKKGMACFVLVFFASFAPLRDMPLTLELRGINVARIKDSITRIAKGLEE